MLSHITLAPDLTSDRYKSSLIVDLRKDHAPGRWHRL
jgi:hypothetical protein